MTVSISRRTLAAIAVLATLVGIALVAIGSGGPDVARAAAGAPASLSCTGKQSGVLTKGQTNGVKNTVPIKTASHRIVRPFDPQSGLPTGATQHQPYVFSLSAATSNDLGIRLTKALVTNEQLTSCTFRYYATNPNGQAVLYLRVVLDNAIVISHSFSHNASDTETWSLTYQTVTWHGTAVITSADWAPAAT